MGKGRKRIAPSLSGGSASVDACVMGLRIRHPACAVMLFLGGTVYADLTPVRWAQDSETTRAPQTASRGNPIVPDVEAQPLTAICPEYSPLRPHTCSSLGHDDSLPVTSIPPAPDSASLFLCAIGTVGAWQVTRSLKRVQFSLAPDWIHTGGPNQIGHSVTLDMDFGASSPCLHDHVVGGRPVWFVVESDEPERCTSPCVLTAVAYRGPPSLL